MAIVDSTHDQDLVDMNQLWGTISELSDQLSRNRTLAVALYGKADVVKVCHVVAWDPRLQISELGRP